MVTVSELKGVSERVDAPSVVADRLEAFGEAVLAGAMNRPVQMVNGGVYLRGLLEQGARKSLEPMVARLGGDADYQSLQQFLADSPWDPGLVVRPAAGDLGAAAPGSGTRERRSPARCGDTTRAMSGPRSGQARARL